MIKAYYQLTKPGIIYGNAVTAIAGFSLAEKGQFNLALLLSMLVGLSLVIGSACVFNNIYDANIDRKMQRTKNRAVAAGVISKASAAAYGIILLLLGFFCLLFTNPYTLATALAGWFLYVCIYTPLKHKTSFATIIGAFPGAVPPVVGYTAVTGHYDLGALILFLILFFWQMPHFYAIAIYRIKDYAEAGIPILPIKKGVKNTKIQIIIYILAFTIAALSLSYFKFTGYTYKAVIIFLAIIWLYKAIKGFKTTDDTLWGKKVFLFSLIVLTTLSLVATLNSWLP